MSETSGSRTLAIIEIGTGVGIALFWAAFFTVGLAPDNPPACYFAYERAFPLPDAILALSLLFAGTMSLKNDRRGPLLSLPAAGALIFLGLLDIGLNHLNGVYALSGFELTTNLAINLWCVGAGAYIIATVWRSLARA